MVRAARCLRSHGLPILVAGMMVLNSGCYNVEYATRTKSFQVLSDPPGALIVQQDQEGQRALGLAPLTVNRSYQTKIRKYKYWTWIFPVLLTLCTIGGISGGVGATDEYGDYDQGDPGIMVMGLLCLPGALATTAISIIGTARSGKELPQKRETLTLRASKEGLLPAEQTFSFPLGPKMLKLALGAEDGAAHRRTAQVTQPAAPRPAGIHAAKRRSDRDAFQGADAEPRTAPASFQRQGKPIIVAVFDVQDAAERFQQRDLVQLTDYLSAKLTQVARFRVIPRKTLREQLVQGKKEGYQTCYDESCQIELGRAVAAEKTLSTKLLKIGNSCAISASLYDLRTEIAEVAASVRSSCSEEGLMDGMDRIASQLAREVR